MLVFMNIQTEYFFKHPTMQKRMEIQENAMSCYHAMSFITNSQGSSLMHDEDVMSSLFY